MTKLPKTVEKRVWIIIGVLASFPIQLLNGPSQIFGLPQNSVILIATGQALFGIFEPLITIFVLGEMIDFVEQKYPHLNEKRKAHFTDFSSGIITCFMGIGQISGPIYGSEFTKIFGYRLTVDIVAIIALTLGLLYFILADGCAAFKKSNFI